MLVCASLRPLRNEETIMNQIDVMKQAVMLLRDGPDNHVQEAVDLLCQAIEQAEKVEPVAWLVCFDGRIGGARVTDKLVIWRKEQAEQQVRAELIQSVEPLYTRSKS
jgi:hypothetical protein